MKVNSVDHNATANGDDDEGLILLITMLLPMETMMKVNSVDHNATAKGDDDEGLILLPTMLLLMEPIIKINQFLDFNVLSSAQGHLRMR